MTYPLCCCVGTAAHLAQPLVRWTQRLGRYGAQKGHQKKEYQARAPKTAGESHACVAVMKGTRVLISSALHILRNVYGDALEGTGGGRKRPRRREVKGAQISMSRVGGRGA